MKINPHKKIDFVFWGTPEVARQTLEVLKENDFLPTYIISSPDRPKDRGLNIQESPVAKFAKENNILCLKPETLEGFELPPSDLSIVVAYGKIIPEKILAQSIFINVHYSLLPKYRGASPVESAILNGEKETGVTIQKMIYKLDAGPILAQKKTEIGSAETALELKKRLIKLGAEMLVKILRTADWKETQQDESQATYAKKITKADGEIDLRDDPVKNYNKFRAYVERPRTFFMKDGKRVIITDAALENGKFLIKKIITEGSKEKNFNTSL